MLEQGPLPWPNSLCAGLEKLDKLKGVWKHAIPQLLQPKTHPTISPSLHPRCTMRRISISCSSNVGISHGIRRRASLSSSKSGMLQRILYQSPRNRTLQRGSSKDSSRGNAAMRLSSVGWSGMFVRMTSHKSSGKRVLEGTGLKVDEAIWCKRNHFGAEEAWMVR